MCRIARALQTSRDLRMQAILRFPGGLKKNCGIIPIKSFSNEANHFFTFVLSSVLYLYSKKDFIQYKEQEESKKTSLFLSLEMASSLIQLADTTIMTTSISSLPPSPSVVRPRDFCRIDFSVIAREKRLCFLGLKLTCLAPGQDGICAERL